MPSKNLVQVMDTTLRDGEQTPDVSYTPSEKLHLARLLLSDVEVDRIEIASTRVSDGELEAAQRITKWARGKRMLDRVEILGYCDGKASVDWMAKAGAVVMNLLVKGSEEHCRLQLGLTPADHRDAATLTLSNATRKRIKTNCYLEDWSNGVRDSFDYVFAMVETLLEAGVQRIYLADTLGVFSPDDVTRYVGLMTATWPEITFEFHAHNDYGLATANCLAAVRAGARGIHTSVNGMGERTGNTRLPEFVATLHDHTELRTQVNEKKLTDISRLVETFSGKDVSANSPIVGRDVFTQTAGIHADGDAKANLYESRLAPRRFGQRRRYALGKLSGKASIDHNLKSLGIDLIPKNRQLVLQRVIELGDKKHRVAAEDLPYIIADVLKTPEEQLVRVESYAVTVGTGSSPEAEVTLSYRKHQARAKASGDGGYDALMNAVTRASKTLGLSVARLTDYRVRIPPGGKTAALVQTLITWHSDRHDEGTFSTLGVDPDQLGAAVIATEKMLNALATRKKPAARKKKTTRKR